jgi:biotin carboxyl carrier protein
VTPRLRVTETDPSGQPVAATARVFSAADPGPRAEPDARSGPRASEPIVSELAGARDGSRRLEVVVDGWRFELEVEDADRADLRRRATRARDAASTSGPTEIRAIIPGRIAAVRVAPGDVVVAGDTLLVIEAMKMQNELRSPRDGTVARVAVGESQTIDAGDLLVIVS